MCYCLLKSILRIEDTKKSTPIKTIAIITKYPKEREVAQGYKMNEEKSQNNENYLTLRRVTSSTPAFPFCGRQQKIQKTNIPKKGHFLGILAFYTIL